jgi:outer membrane protein assembly factor BamB
MPGETRIFISHTFEDNNACVPLTAALDAWEIPYHFDTSTPAAAPMLSPEVQQALTASNVFIRVCTRNTTQSIPMSLESGAYRGLQAQRGGRQRTLINLILDPGYQREPFDNATLFIDATTKSRFDWLSELARALGITTLGRRLSRRSAIALGGAGAVAVASATSAGVVLARNRPSTAQGQSRASRIATLSGQTKWTLTISQNTFSTPELAASGTALYVFSDAGLEALSPADGKTLWSQVQITSSAAVVPAVVNGVIYVVDSSANLVAASAHDGHVLWKQPAGSFKAYSSPAAASDGVYLVQDDGRLYAYKPSDGSPLWKAAIGISPNSLFSNLRPPPSAAAGVVYIGSDDHNLYALNASDGSVKWKFLTRGRIYSTPAVANGRVYFGSEDGYVYAVNASDHTQAWSYQTDFDVASSPVVVNGVVYIGSRDHYLYALDAQHGFAYWRALAGDVDPNGGTTTSTTSSTSDRVDCLPAVGYDTVYVTAGAFVYAFNIVDGKRLWRFKTNRQSTMSSPVLAGNLVFAGVDDKTLNAINI